MIEEVNVSLYRMKQGFEDWLKKLWIKKASGMGVVEIILILVVLIALVAIFKDQITLLVNNILSKITTNAGRI